MLLICPRYKEEESRTASRAGHSAMLLREGGRGHGYKLMVFGGRDSADCDVAGRWGKGQVHVSEMAAKHKSHPPPPRRQFDGGAK